jgi:hypothetical protein
LIQPQTHGTEMGWAAGDGSNHSWAYVYGGGWTPQQDADNVATLSGVQFAKLVKQLGGPEFKIEGPVQGSAPNVRTQGIQSGGGGAGAPLFGGGRVPSGRAYDWGPLLRRCSHWLDVHGRRAQFHAKAAEILVRNTTYVTTKKPRG